VQPGGGYFVWVVLPEEVDTDMLLKASPDYPDAEGRAVRFTPGTRCSPSDSLSNCLRLSFAFYPAETIEHGVAMLGTLVDSELAKARVK
jgi:DNA-binding transcriptional MocR family regulator